MDGYFEHAFPDDELRPVNNTGDSNRVYGCGWGLSVVDALSTAIIMELDDIVERSLDFIDTIDFTRTPTNSACRLFEVNVSVHQMILINPTSPPLFSLTAEVWGVDITAN